MKNRKKILTYIVAALSILVTSASSLQAAPAQTYHGTLTGGDFFCNGELLVPPPYSVSGFWKVVINTETPAQLSLRVFYDSRRHLTFRDFDFELISFVDGVYVFSGFEGIVIATLDTNQTPASFAYQAELGGGCPPERPYDSLTYFGLANRGGG